MLRSRLRGPYSHIGSPPQNQGYDNPVLESKRQAALAYLGRKWILHPEYAPTDRHDTDPTVYVFARLPYLAAVVTAARFCRAHKR